MSDRRTRQFYFFRISSAPGLCCRCLPRLAQFRQPRSKHVSYIQQVPPPSSTPTLYVSSHGTPATLLLGTMRALLKHATGLRTLLFPARQKDGRGFDCFCVALFVLWHPKCTATESAAECSLCLSSLFVRAWFSSRVGYEISGSTPVAAVKHVSRRRPRSRLFRFYFSRAHVWN